MSRQRTSRARTVLLLAAVAILAVGVAQLVREVVMLRQIRSLSAGEPLPVMRPPDVVLRHNDDTKSLAWHLRLTGYRCLVNVSGAGTVTNASAVFALGGEEPRHVFFWRLIVITSFVVCLGEGLSRLKMKQPKSKTALV